MQHRGYFHASKYGGCLRHASISRNMNGYTGYEMARKSDSLSARPRSSPTWPRLK